MNSSEKGSTIPVESDQSPTGEIKRQRCRIAAIAMVKNEQDIIEPFVRHNIRFLDHMMVLDNGSVDDTRPILKKLNAEFSNLMVVSDDSFGYTQSERMTLLLNRSQAIFPADFVVLLDADEFICCTDPASFADVLARIPSGGFGMVAWSTFVLTPKMLSSLGKDEEDHFRAMTWRRRVEWEPYHKAIVRLDGNSAADVLITQGNHSVCSARGVVLAHVFLPELKLCHYPVRSREQLIAKAVVGWMAYLAKDPLASLNSAGFQWRDNFQAIANGAYIDDSVLCEASILYSQSPRNVNWDEDVIQEPNQLVYERRYSTGRSMDAIQLIVRSWQQSIAGPATKVVERLITAGRTAEAIAYLDATIAQEETSDLWNAWAALQHKGGAMKEAERGFRRALELDKTNRQAAVNLGFVLFSQGRLKEGAPLFQQHERTLTEEEKSAMLKLAEQWQPQDTSISPASANSVTPHASHFSVTDIVKKSIVIQELEVLEKFLNETPEHELQETVGYIVERLKLNFDKIQNTNEEYLAPRIGAIFSRIRNYLEPNLTSKTISLLQITRDDIDKATVVSFDIFDTLLVRPYVKPTDLFYHIEHIKNSRGFAEHRINAEKKAREHFLKNTENEDVTIEDIYKFIDHKFLSLKETELNMERQTLRINPEVKQIFDYAKNKNKRIIIVSDMYLPLDFIEDVLKKNGITDYEKIYLSSKLNGTKHSSKLYQLILDELKILPACVFHIGDNRKSDYDSALQVGINAFHYTQLVQQYFSQNNKIKSFYVNNSSSVVASVLVSVQAYKWKVCCLGIELPNYWEKLGYYFSGLVALAFCKFIKQQSDKRNINKILFCARDGYVLQKVFNFLYKNSGIETDYIYANRVAHWYCNLVYDGDLNSENFVSAKLILEYYKNQSTEFAKLCEANPVSQTMPVAFIEQQKEILTRLSEEPKDKYRNYFNQKTCQYNTVAIVDLLSCNFTSQRFVENLINKNLTGFYIYANKESPYYSENKMVSWGNTIPSPWNFWEFAITSHEPPIYDITQEHNPIYIESDSIYEKFRNSAYPFVEKGTIDFVKDIYSLFGNDGFPADFELVFSYCKSFFENYDNEDVENLQQLYHAVSHANNFDYKPIFPFFNNRDIIKTLTDNITHLKI
ncbi:MAG: HAD-IA family hydrolase [Acidobacteria bacterium]|nr:HAD-IA family hydrolase [Acidobacteriota bacterium]